VRGAEKVDGHIGNGSPPEAAPTSPQSEDLSHHSQNQAVKSTENVEMLWVDREENEEQAGFQHFAHNECKVRSKLFLFSPGFQCQFFACVVLAHGIVQL